MKSKDEGDKMKEFKDMLGKTITEIDGGIGDEEMVFTMSDGSKGVLYYEHD